MFCWADNKVDWRFVVGETDLRFFAGFRAFSLSEPILHFQFVDGTAKFSSFPLWAKTGNVHGLGLDFLTDRPQPQTESEKTDFAWVFAAGIAEQKDLRHKKNC